MMMPEVSVKKLFLFVTLPHSQTSGQPDKYDKPVQYAYLFVIVSVPKKICFKQ
jgi:hypothetical protein